MIQYEVYDKLKDPLAYFKQLVSTFTALRLEYKKKSKEDKYYDDLQSSYKIFINSCYGFLGTAGLNFNSPANASFVTATGRSILSRTMDWVRDSGFVLVNADTDSVSIARKDGRDFTGDKDKLLTDVNSLFPEKIRFEDDGFYKKVLVMAAKNYAMMKMDGTVKYKGSAIKSSKLEPATKEFIYKIIDSILNDKTNYTEIYNSYIKEINNLKDIKRWAAKKTITQKVMTSERTNETKVKDAIAGTEYREGDKIYVYYDKQDNLKLIERYANDYNKDRLYKRLYDASWVFEQNLDVDNIFPNYSLKRNKELLGRVS